MAIAVLVIVILIAGVYVYLYTYDYNKLKPLVARMVEDATGRELHLGGEISLAIGFAPSSSSISTKALPTARPLCSIPRPAS